MATGAEWSFLGLASLPADILPSVVVLPVPWERSTSYVQGTREGPQAILRASRQVELYDEELDADTWRAGIDTLPALRPTADQAPRALAAIRAAVAEILERQAFPLLLGGEHTLTVGAVGAVAERYPDLTVLQIDAHADLRSSFRGDAWSHACTMSRVREICPHVGVGIRALSRAEAERIASCRWPIWRAADCVGGGWIEEVVEELSEHVYISVDLDGLDPSVIPAVGTPEPAGLNWRQCLQLLRRCTASRTVVGADLVELCPDGDGVRSAFAAARLAYRLIGYVLTAGGRRPAPRSIEAPEEDG
ncbi:MAG: agmatinase [Acidobacteriota bacterium]